MSTLKTNAVQVGQSGTATNNFTLYQPTTPDGTVRLGNGNFGAVTDKVTIDSNGNITAVGTITAGDGITATDGSGLIQAGNIQATSYNGGQLAGLRNKIINGDMGIWQRGTAAYTSVANGTYTVDRFFLRSSYTGGTTTITQSTGPNQQARFSLRVTHATATATAVTAQHYAVRQAIEKSVARGFATGSNLTFSFWYKSNRTGAHAFAFDAGVGGACFTGTTTAGASTFTVNVADTWEYKSLTFPLAITGNGTNAETGVGALLTIGFADASLTTFSSILVGDYFDITAVQLEVGPVATPFEQRPIGMELALCQRYFTKTFDQSVAPATNAGYTGAIAATSGASLGNAAATNYVYPVEMRSTPLITTFNPSAANSSWRNFNDGTDVTSSVLSNGTRQAVFVIVGVPAPQRIHMIHATANAEL